jgi:hypothetical protein
LAYRQSRPRTVIEAPSSIYSPTPYAYLDRDLDTTPSYSLPNGPRVDHLSTRMTEVTVTTSSIYHTATAASLDNLLSWMFG